MVDSKIIEDAKHFVRQVQDGISIKSAYLFGSYVTGNNHESSDIDIAIVSDDFLGFSLMDNERILRNTKNINRMIEPHPFKTEDFTMDNPFVKEIVTTGIRIC